MTYRPEVTAQTSQDPDIQLGFCAKVDTIARLTAEFRIAVNGSRPVRVDLNLVSLLGRNPLDKGISIVWCFDPRKIQFRENSFVTEWFSLTEVLNNGEAVIEDNTGSEISYQTQLERVKTTMMKLENKVSFRFEVETTDVYRILLQT